MAAELLSLLRFAHILTVVFMAAPYYNLVVVNERAMAGKTHADVDRYMERMVRRNAVRCYVFQATALATGALLVAVAGLSFTEPWPAAKLALLAALMALLSVIHFRVQPRIDALLGGVSGDAIPEEVLGRIKPLRVLRKRLAGVCLFLLTVTVLVAVVRFEPLLLAALVPLAAAFSWAVYRKGAAWGWV